MARRGLFFGVVRCLLKGIPVIIRKWEPVNCSGVLKETKSTTPFNRVHGPR